MRQGLGPRLVLASGSAARAAILRSAGLTFRVLAAELDETAIKTAGRAKGSTAGAVAMTLAEAKATAVGMADGHAGAFVIGADQLLEWEGSWHDKPADLAAATRQLRMLQGRTHHLHTASGRMVRRPPSSGAIWACLPMTMRPLSDAWIERYLQAEGSGILGCVGCYPYRGSRHPLLRTDSRRPHRDHGVAGAAAVGGPAPT